MSARPPLLLLYFYMVAMILCGAGNGVATKLTDKSISLGHKFEHPYFQSFTMFIGESFCMLVYIYEMYMNKKKYGSFDNIPEVIEARQKGKSTNINPLRLAIPMLCDAAGSTLLLFAYLYIPVSVAQMMQGCIVLVTAILSIIFLRRLLSRHHWTGLFLVVVGIALVGLAVMLAKNDSEDENPIVGLLLMVGSILIQGSQFVVEEKFLGDYYLSPMKVVGWEGIWGLILFLILLPILQFIPCHLEFCSHTGVVEDSWFALRQIYHNSFTLIMLICSVIFIAGYNGFGITITKHMSATSRTTLKQTKIVLVWVFFLLYRGDGHESFKWLQLVGFIILVSGILLYNEIVIIPWCGFNKYTTFAKLEREKKVDTLISEELYTQDNDSIGDMVNTKR